MSRKENKWDRYWVITAGERCNVDDLRDRIQWLHRRISKLNSQPFMKDAGVSIAFRASEITVKIEDSEATYHPHANCLIHLEKKLPKNEWKKLLSQARDFIGHHFSDSGAVMNHREICKYITKPADLKKLTPNELAELFHAVTRLRMVAPMGGFKAQLSSFKDNKLKLIRKVTDDGTQWAVVNDWNAHGKKSEAEELNEAASKLEESSTRDPNKILARLAPGPHFGRVCEPAAIVRVFDGDVGSIMRHPLIAPIAAYCRDNWQSGLAIAEAEQSTAHLSSQITRNCPPGRAEKTGGAEQIGLPNLVSVPKPPPKIPIGVI